MIRWSDGHVTRLLDTTYAKAQCRVHRSASRQMSRVEVSLRRAPPARAPTRGNHEHRGTAEAVQRSGRTVMTDEIWFLDATDLARLVRDGELSPVEVVRAHLDRIADLGPKLGAVVSVRVVF